jgi:hypothetical protein
VRAAAGVPVLHVYAIVDRVPSSLGAGLDAVPLRVVVGDRFVAVVGEHQQAPTLGDDQLCTYEALHERLATEVSVLPLRFGTTVAGEAELRTWLRANEADLLELFDAVRGAVELSVRADLPVEATLRARIHRPLALLARRAILFAPGPGSGRLRAAYLVDGEHIDPFAAVVERLGRELGVEISCTGPWPPYSFVGEVGR